MSTDHLPQSSSSSRFTARCLDSCSYEHGPSLLRWYNVIYHLCYLGVAGARYRCAALCPHQVGGRWRGTFSTFSKASTPLRWGVGPSFGFPRARKTVVFTRLSDCYSFHMNKRNLIGLFVIGIF